MNARGMYRAIISFCLVSLLVLFSFLMIPSAADGEGVLVSDGIGDVIRTGYVDVEVGGYGEIDIISLSSTETISDMTIVLECSEDITDEVGYLYTISVSGIHIAYQDGIFQVWRLGGEVQTVDNVQTGVSDNEITIVVMKTSIVEDLVLNATANFYALDLTAGATSESYYDLAGQIDGRTRAPGDYTISYDDDEGDVRLIYLDQRPADEDGLDIVSLSIFQGTDITFKLRLFDEPIFGESVEYRIFIGKIKLIWSNGAAFLYPLDGGREGIDSSVEGETIELIVPEEDLEGDIGGVIVLTRLEIDENTYIEDLLPDDPYSLSELIPFPPGTRREIKLDLRSPDNVIMERSYSNFHSLAREDIRSSVDTNEDGNVDASEAASFIEGLEDDLLSSDHDEDLTLDGQEGTMELSILETGLIGPVDSSTQIEISFILEFMFDTSDVWEYRYDVEIEFIDPGFFSSLVLDEDQVDYLVLINISEGWELNPLSLEPAELSNHIAHGGTVVEHTLEGKDAREFDPGSISFEIRKKSSIDVDDDDEAVGEDLTWLYVIILIVMVAIIAGVLIWYRREE